MRKVGIPKVRRPFSLKFFFDRNKYQDHDNFYMDLTESNLIVCIWAFKIRKGGEVTVLRLRLLGLSLSIHDRPLLETECSFQSKEMQKEDK